MFYQRNLDTELTRKELLEFLVAMEGELQAKEIAFAALKVRRCLDATCINGTQVVKAVLIIGLMKAYYCGVS